MRMMRGVEPRGHEWIVDARGCDPARLVERAALQAVFDALVAELGLHPVGSPLWHTFPGTHGQTGLWLLAESHLACHSFPEHGGLTLNLFCCRTRPDWDWPARLAALVGARQVQVTSVAREYGPLGAHPTPTSGAA
jgi:S-adenosylmethionine decarboxylase